MKTKQTDNNNNNNSRATITSTIKTHTPYQHPLKQALKGQDYPQKPLRQTDFQQKVTGVSKLGFEIRGSSLTLQFNHGEAGTWLHHFSRMDLSLDLLSPFVTGNLPALSMASTSDTWRGG